ncbi:aminotransferase class IV [Moraxella nasovis]|uniref:aminotransferase class IV n=1 Tax=Moraxella nasovis TaxID=2904121 RepID=UPI001F6161B6|nr:aminotransferase class IV [Moraxella nasovis]UNU74192.1 aminotransferase class IV [Moraxella nasovis]
MTQIQTVQFYHLTDGQMVASNQAMDERAFAYGDGFFSTMGVKDGVILWADWHRVRLVDCAWRFCLDIDVSEIMTHLTALAAAMGYGMLKIIITRHAQKVRGYGFLAAKIGRRAQVFIKIMPSPIYDAVSFIGEFPIQKSGQAWCLTEKIGIRPSRFYGVKLISCHEHVFIHHELLQAQAAQDKIIEGLVQNTAGEWICGVSSNVFYQLDGKWYTPSLNGSGVNGTVRKALLSYSLAVERVLCDNDLTKITAMAFTNAVKGVIPIDGLWYRDVYHVMQTKDALPSLLGYR